MNHAELLKVIKNPAKEEVAELNLNFNQLSALPPEIGQLQQLTGLHLMSNQLSALPPEIGQLQQLTTLYLSGNQLSALPPEIGQLQQLTTLYLISNQLSALPPEIGQLQQLTELYLSGNQLSALPPEIIQLQQLTELYLSGNQLSALPPEIIQLQQLTELYLSGNQLSALPPEISQLQQLTELDLGGNQLSALPPEIGQLQQLTTLHLGDNQLSALPPEISQLQQLTELDLGGNQLSELPCELHQLQALKQLFLDNNPALRFPPEEIVELGVEGIRNFLRAAQAGNAPVWESKLLLIGEGGVGKTSVFNALKGKLLSKTYEPGTVGIDIGDLYLPHPDMPGVQMHLNCWDFAGQDFNHATHQFFFSNRTLFLLVWNARHGWQQGKLYRWLENVKVRAPEAKVILVATHIDQPYSDYPFEDLQQQYLQIVGKAEVSNETGEGIAELYQLIRQHAATLPLMGLRWPQTWLHAASDIRTLSDEHYSRRSLHRLMQTHGLNQAECGILTSWLHELGDILHFDDELELRDRVILQPQWLTKHVGIVLRSDEVAAQDGILTRPHLQTDLWPHLDDYIQDHFLRLMDKFDLAYLIPDDPDDRSLIVERLPLNTPNYQEPWDAFKDQGNEIRLRFRLGSMQPGIPTWFIARCHRFTMRIHWLNGVLFRDEDDRHRALIIADEQQKTVDMAVRGPFPQRFMTLLQDGFRDTLKRYKGLEVKRRVPCPGGYNDLIDGACRNEFDLASLENWLIKRPNDIMFQCPDCGEELSRLQLVEGIGAAALTQDFTAERFAAIMQTGLEKTSREITQHIDKRYDDMIAYEKRNFLLAWQREQEQELITCPNLFTIRPLNRGGLFTAEQYHLQLYCQYYKGWHSIEPQGLYTFSQTREWFQKALPYLLTLHQILKVVVPLGAAALGAAGDASSWAKDQHKVFENDFKLMDEMLKQVDKLPMEVEPLSEMMQEVGVRPTFRKHKDAELVVVRELMDVLAEQDRENHRAKWSGLTRRQTPEGDILWLCGGHLTEYESKRRAVAIPPGYEA